jgi:hypothetical protein
MNGSITAATTYTTLLSFMFKKNKASAIRRNLQVDLISQLQYQELQLILLQVIELQGNHYCYLLQSIFWTLSIVPKFFNHNVQGMALPSSSGELTLVGPVDRASLYRSINRTHQSRFT